ncbi:hypothetical protein SeLEV6574_g07269 [Synchytrium endobioticum]|uniref:Uncharacterized protein n=1 Tax=Synchytrium endobioticum TaxID=286115 RepID=A0A507CLC4_9FUNG|nr:hypothetical protein SeLEV6574_g07269 [Synchytrium endobioticum]
MEKNISVKADGATQPLPSRTSAVCTADSANMLQGNGVTTLSASQSMASVVLPDTSPSPRSSTTSKCSSGVHTVRGLPRLQDFRLPSFSIGSLRQSNTQDDAPPPSNPRNTSKASNFENLLFSGATAKLSLTPDTMKNIEERRPTSPFRLTPKEAMFTRERARDCSPDEAPSRKLESLWDFVKNSAPEDYASRPETNPVSLKSPDIRSSSNVKPNVGPKAFLTAKFDHFKASSTPSLNTHSNTHSRSTRTKGFQDDNSDGEEMSASLGNQRIADGVATVPQPSVAQDRRPSCEFWADEELATLPSPAATTPSSATATPPMHGNIPSPIPASQNADRATLASILKELAGADPDFSVVMVSESRTASPTTGQPPWPLLKPTSQSCVSLGRSGATRGRRKPSQPQPVPSEVPSPLTVPPADTIAATRKQAPKLVTGPTATPAPLETRAHNSIASHYAAFVDSHESAFLGYVHPTLDPRPDSMTPTSNPPLHGPRFLVEALARTRESKEAADARFDTLAKLTLAKMTQWHDEKRTLEDRIAELLASADRTSDTTRVLN